MFGKVVGGLPVLDALEGRDVGPGDKPIDAINILKATVFANPAADWDAAAPARVAEAARVEAEAEAAKSRGSGPKFTFSNPAPQAAGGVEVGKYLKIAQAKKKKKKKKASSRASSSKATIA